MSDPTKQPKPKFRDERKDGLHKLTLKFEDGLRKITRSSPQPSRSRTPAPSNRQGLSPGATTILPPDHESAPRHVDHGEDSLKGAKTDTSDTVQSKPGSDLYIKLYLKSTHTLPDPGWQAWNIDGNTISELRVWGDRHGNSNWRQLADKIDQSLKSDTIKAVQDFIPDSPFPAKILVKALLSLRARWQLHNT
ncbi:hypothetical protein B0H13DRAFT_1875980 [Mycena leptocephala]|nr:hypothetical protein B0H13DRAFT_1875980 [Mycena leptocephala]